MLGGDEEALAVSSPPYPVTIGALNQTIGHRCESVLRRFQRFFSTSSQRWILLHAIACFGKWGLIVPALVTSPSSNLMSAQALASASVSNVLVDRGHRLRGTVFDN
jgi:hypothetical protein